MTYLLTSVTFLAIIFGEVKAPVINCLLSEVLLLTLIVEILEATVLKTLTVGKIFS